jgi:HPt (histidine-containing phosphotransfer) domain-containing protein
MTDPLAPNRAAFWSAIDDRLAAIDQGLNWMDLTQARSGLTDFSSSLRMLGLADLAALAETLEQGFSADPRHLDRLSEFQTLQAAVAAAQAGGGIIPIVEASLKRCLLVVSAEAPIADMAKELPGWRRIVARDAAAATVWLRRGDIHAVLLDPELPGDARAWLNTLPTSIPLLLTAPWPDAGRGSVLPALDRPTLQTALTHLP